MTNNQIDTEPGRISELQKLRSQEMKVHVWGRNEVLSLRSYDEYKCIFVHVPRTGGVAIAKSLFGNLGGSHISISLYRKVFSDVFDGYYKFTFVRNPWDRLVSAY